MTENKFLIDAIGNEPFQKVLSEIRKLAIIESRDDEQNGRLETLLFRARAFARMTDPEIERADILETVKNATGDDLDIILGDYRGEIPVVEQAYILNPKIKSKAYQKSSVCTSTILPLASSITTTPVFLPPSIPIL